MTSRTVVTATVKPSPARFGRKSLRRWYQPRRSAYPWRRTRDPYRVLVSEVMLQQTQASRVVPIYLSFLRRFPTLRSLAGASRRDVVIAWGGLGYNRRAATLSETARAVLRDRGGRVPRDVAMLRRFPGVGPYTAAAVASIAFGVPVPAVDTNARRVVARTFLGVDADDATGRAIDELAAAWVDPEDPGGWNQALMDLGREVCRPRPRCSACPLRRGCRYAQEGPKSKEKGTRGDRFEGSSRQARGAVIRALCTEASGSLDGLVRATSLPLGRVASAVAGLAHDGLVAAGPAALAGRPRGRVRLAG
jgi:A/G-specific adenine glycosylase